MVAAPLLRLRGTRRLPRAANSHAAPGAGASLDQHARAAVGSGRQDTVFHRLDDPIQRQIVRRAINERVRELSRHYAAGRDVEFVCECGRAGCLEVVSLSPATYEQIRRSPTRFLTKPGHADDAQTLARSRQVVVVEQAGLNGHAAIESL